ADGKAVEIGRKLVTIGTTFSVNVFFFSSRRRHTRSDRDWSSDVCSSDLVGPGGALVSVPVRGGSPATLVAGGVSLPAIAPAGGRSEERRVGKECRARGGGGIREKKNDALNGRRDDSVRLVCTGGGPLRVS